MVIYACHQLTLPMDMIFTEEFVVPTPMEGYVDSVQKIVGFVGHQVILTRLVIDVNTKSLYVGLMLIVMRIHWYQQIWQQ